MKQNGKLLLSLVTFVVTLFAGCQIPNPSFETHSSPSPIIAEISAEPTAIPLPTPDQTDDTVSNLTGSKAFGFTYQQPDGNRLVYGAGTFPEVKVLDIPLEDRPKWLVAIPSGLGSIWVTILQNGKTKAFEITNGEVQTIDLQPSLVSPLQPQLLTTQDGLPTLLQSPAEDTSSTSHPVPLDAAGKRLAFISNDGDLVIWDEDEIDRLEINALPDARILVREDGQLLVLIDPTSRYRHAVLGDDIEAGGIAWITTQPNLHWEQLVSISEPEVIEGLAPIWVDLDDNGDREIIVTVSDPQQGARLVVFDMAGNRLAEGPPIGRGYRWRHQLAVAPFSPTGEMEIADILTPHIGGVVEFFRLEGNQLVRTAQITGFSSHTLGSRNLDMALSGDFDGDGRIELLVPTQAQDDLTAIEHTTNGAEAEWSLSIGTRISTNLAGVTLRDGKIAVGVGHQGNALRIWVPKPE